MDALVLRVAPRHGRAAVFHKFGGAEVSVGRGLHNDLIVADPYLGAEQFRFRRAGELILLDVLDDTNTVTRNGVACRGAGIALAPGDVIAAGQSVLEVLLESSAVPAARVVSSSLWARLRPWRPALALLSLGLVLGAELLVDYLGTYEEPDWGELLAGPLFLLLAMFAWATLWAVLGRVLRGQARFATQLFVSALVTLLTMGVTLAAPYLAYASGLDAAVNALDWTLTTALSFALLYANLRFATSLHRPALAAAGVVALLLLAIHGLQWIGEERFTPYPVTQTLLKPPFAKLRAGMPLDSYQREIGEFLGGFDAD